MSTKSGSQKRRKKRERRLDEAKQFDEKGEVIAVQAAADFSARFDNWTMTGEQYRVQVRAGLQAHPEVQPTFRKQNNRPASPLTVDELAVTLFAVGAVGKSDRGFSYLRQQLAFQAVGLGWQRSKGAAARRALVALRLIHTIGGHKAGRNGTKYALGPGEPYISNSRRLAAAVPTPPRPSEPGDDGPFDSTPGSAPPSVIDDIFNIPRDGSNIRDEED